jgi:hypothetical protein
MNAPGKNNLALLSAAILIIMMVLSVVFLAANKKSQVSDQVTAITHAHVTSPMEDGSYSLPLTLKDMSPGTPVKVSFSVASRPGTSLYFISLYCPLQIYADGHLIYEFGLHDTYPSYFSDPPYIVDSCFLPTNGSSSITNIDMVYTFPNERNAIAISQPVIGTSKSLMHMLFLKSGMSAAISIVDILFGSILVFMSVLGALLNVNNNGSVLWLGLFAFISGTWILSSSMLITYMSGNPSLLYMVSYIAFYLIPIPIVLFEADMLDLKHNSLVRGMLLVLSVFFISSLLLQLFGIVPFMKSVYVFHVLAAVSITMIAYLATRYSVHNENVYVRFFHVPFVVFDVCVLAEIANYYVRIFTELSSMFEIGLNLFLLLSVIDTGLFMAASARSAISDKELNSSLSFLRNQVEVEQSLFRHSERPVSDSLYFMELASENNIHADIHVDAVKYVPSDSAEDVNAILRNLIIMSIASCCQLPQDKRYIRMHLNVNGRMVSITLDYSIIPASSASGSAFFSTDTRSSDIAALNAVNKTVGAHGGEMRCITANGLNSISVLMKI